MLSGQFAKLLGKLQKIPVGAPLNGMCSGIEVADLTNLVTQLLEGRTHSVLGNRRKTQFVDANTDLRQDRCDDRKWRVVARELPVSLRRRHPPGERLASHRHQLSHCAIKAGSSIRLVIIPSGLTAAPSGHTAPFGNQTVRMPAA